MNLKYEYGLPNKLAGKSFADASKAIERMFKNRLSTIDSRTKKVLMSRLKDVQENERQKEQSIQQPKYQNQMAGGGWGDVDDIINTNDSNNEVGNFNGFAGNMKSNWFSRQLEPNSWLNKNEGENRGSLLGGVGVAASILGPMIANRRAMKTLQKPDVYNPNLLDENQYKPDYVNRQQLLRNASEQVASQRYAIGQMGGNSAQQSAMMANLNTNRLGTTGNLMLQSDLADQQERQRIQALKTNVQQFNIGQKDKAYDINQQNQAAYYNQMAAYKQAQGANIGAIGQSLFNLMQAKQYGKEMGKAGILRNS